MMKLPVIALGTWSWGAGAAGGDQVFGNHTTEKNLRPIFEAGMKAGLNLWDTAAVYGMGASETILGKFVSEVPREDIILSTKFTPQIASSSPSAMEKLFNSSLERLRTDYIDIYWIHNPTDAPKWVSSLIPLLKSGKVKNVGVSNHNIAQIKEANEILATASYKVSAVQNHYSLLYRSSEDAGILDYCKVNKITFYSYMVLEQGTLTGKYGVSNPLPEDSGRGQTYNKMLPQLEELINAMKEIGSTKDATVSQIAMAWAIAKNTLPIVGVTKVSHVEEAANASTILLTEDEITRLEELSAKTGVDTKGAWEQPMI